MPTVSCFTAITHTIAQGFNHLQQRAPFPFSQPGNHAAPINTQNGHPAGERNTHGIRQRGWQRFVHFMRINRHASGTTNGSPGFRHADGPESLNGDGLGTASSLSTGMRACLTSALIPPQPGEQQQPLDEVWAAVYQFDTQRRSGENSCALKQDFPELEAIAGDETHPSHEDAKLFKDILTRPIGPEEPSLEEYVAKKVEAGLDLYMGILPNPDFRTFNSIQPGLATSTLDYNSAGRTLLFKGATHLIGIPSRPAVMDNQLTEGQLDRKGRLQKTMFSFPKHPADGVDRLKLSDFDAMIDPLDNLGVYESSGPQLP